MGRNQIRAAARPSSIRSRWSLQPEKTSSYEPITQAAWAATKYELPLVHRQSAPAGRYNQRKRVLRAYYTSGMGRNQIRAAARPSSIRATTPLYKRLESR
jgi:hypothetical protein